MIEIPESKTLATQAKETLRDKKVRRVCPPSNRHGFAWFSGDPAEYGKLFEGIQITDALGHGGFVDIFFESGVSLVIGDGTNMRYVKKAFTSEDSSAHGSAIPQKYQLLIEFTDDSALVFTIAMYGGIWASSGEFDNPYHRGSLASVSPLDSAFNDAYFENLLAACKKNLSAKAFLTTEQRIPGLGNGCVQDILLTCGVHPKCKISTLSPRQKDDMFYSLKAVLEDMSTKGGRDTEKDLFGNAGGYKTLLSKKTYKNPCPLCGAAIIKESYMGGSVYFCPNCQKLA